MQASATNLRSSAISTRTRWRSRLPVSGREGLDKNRNVSLHANACRMSFATTTLTRLQAVQRGTLPRLWLLIRFAWESGDDGRGAYRGSFFGVKVKATFSVSTFGYTGSRMGYVGYPPSSGEDAARIHQQHRTTSVNRPWRKAGKSTPLPNRPLSACHLHDIEQRNCECYRAATHLQFDCNSLAVQIRTDRPTGEHPDVERESASHWS